MTVNLSNIDVNARVLFYTRPPATKEGKKDSVLDTMASWMYSANSDYFLDQICQNWMLD